MFILAQLQGGTEQRKVSPWQHKIFSIGTAFHLMMDYYMGTRAAEFGYQYQVEKRAQHLTLPIAGRVDAITTGWPLPNCPVAWDYKSISSAEISRLTRPSAKYVLQVNTYMGMLDIPICVLLYINKERGGFYPFITYFDESLWISVEKRVERISGSPLEVRRAVSPECKTCVYQEECGPPV